MKKKITLYVALCLLIVFNDADAQADLQNAGIIYVTGSADTVYINGSLTNAGTAALTNNGNLFLSNNLVNSQAAMPAGLGTLYLNGTALQIVSGTQPFKTFNLVTGNAAGFTLNNDLSVSGVHHFSSGIITTSTVPNYLIYEAGASVTGAGDNMHVKGWVRKTGSTGFVFPVGNGTYERTIAISNLSAASVFNTRYAGATTNTGNVAGPLAVVDPNEYWIVNQVSGGTANIDMNWDNSKITMPNYILPEIRVANYLTGNWTQVGGSASGNTSTTGSISSNITGAFGAFVLGSISVLLPVNLVNFSATKNNGNAVISWTTTNELNVSHYEVQRSDDGRHFYTIGQIRARNLPVLQQYTFTDPPPLSENTYYRLQTKDPDGKTTISKVVMLSGRNVAEQFLTVANPVHGVIRITSGNLSGYFNYRINMLSGQTVQQGLVEINSSNTDIPVSASVKPGLYILQVQKSGFVITHKIILN